MTGTALRLLLVGGLALGSLTACAGGDDSGTGSPTASATPSPTATALTRARAKAIAQASLLTAADLPGYEATPGDKTEDPAEKKAEAKFLACVGAPTPAYLAEESSDDFSKGQVPMAVEVSSNVDVVKTQEEGRADLQAYLSDKVPACLEDFIADALKSEAGAGVTLAKSEVTRVEIPKPVEASDAFGLRFDGSISAGGQSLQLAFTVAAALVDRAELSVTTFAFGQETPSVEEQSRLLNLMATRALSAQQG